MRVLRSRRLIYALASLVAVGGVGLVALDPVVRAAVNSEAQRRHLEVGIGAVHLGWFAVRLEEVSVRPAGWGGVNVTLARLSIPLTATLRPAALEARGGSVHLQGSAAELAAGAARWLASAQGGSGHAAPVSGSLPISVEDVSLDWVDEAVTVVELTGLSIHRDRAGAAVGLRSGRCRVARRLATIGDAKVELTSTLGLAKARIRSLSVDSADGGHAVDADSVLPPGAPTSDAPSQDVEAGSPLFTPPDLRRTRADAATLVRLASERVPVGAELRVDELTFKLGSGSPRHALTIGPGSFSLSRSPSALDVQFSTGPRDKSSSLSVNAALPTEESGDVTLLVQGGPVSLSALGIRDGEWGLAETDRATVAGRVSVTLAGDGSSLTFDADGAALGMAIQEPRLATDVVRGLDVALRARGLATSDGQLRLDDFAATLGAIHLSASGALDQQRDHVAGSLRAELASAPCQSLLDSLPTSLLPALEVANVGGTMGAHGQLTFDTRSLDDQRLDYDVQDECHVTEVRESLSREHFRQPFAHRIYLPDGSTSEHLTGPGTKDWTALESISPYMQVAVLTTEDGAFLKHRGFNRSAIRASIIANLKARRFIRGASTITMQLAKNLFLSRNKTLSRKLEEVVLTEYLEQAFSKDELMELYLNVIEFGPGVYGIGPASEYYFGRTPAELKLAECLFLSSLLPAPIRYSKMHEAEQLPDGWMRTLRATMQIANKRGLISDGRARRRPGRIGRVLARRPASGASFPGAPAGTSRSGRLRRRVPGPSARAVGSERASPDVLASSAPKRTGADARRTRPQGHLP